MSCSAAKRPSDIERSLTASEGFAQQTLIELISVMGLGCPAETLSGDAAANASADSTTHAIRAKGAGTREIAWPMPLDVEAAALQADALEAIIDEAKAHGIVDRVISTRAVATFLSFVAVGAQALEAASGQQHPEQWTTLMERILQAIAPSQ